MLFKLSLRPYTLMGGLIALALVLASIGGMLQPDIYRPFLSPGLVAFQFIQDTMTLLFAPALLAAMYLASRGSARGLVVWVGLLIGTVYYYSFAVFDFFYTVYYPLYLALVGLGTYSLIGLLTAVDVDAFAQRVNPRLPVRLVAFVLGMTLLFVPIWGMFIAQGITSQKAGETDLVVVLDLCFLIPACSVAAVQVWRRRPVGYLLSGPLLLKSVMSGIILSGGEIQKTLQGGSLIVEQFSMYLFLAVVGTTALVLYLHNIQPMPTVKALRPDVRPVGH